MGWPYHRDHVIAVSTVEGCTIECRPVIDVGGVKSVTLERAVMLPKTIQSVMRDFEPRGSIIPYEPIFVPEVREKYQPPLLTLQS